MPSAAESSADLKFPVIWIGTAEVRSFVDLEHLCTCNRAFLKAGHFKHGALVDSGLILREVKAIRVLGGVPPFAGYRLPGTRMVRLEYEFAGAIREVTLDELKTMIVMGTGRSSIYDGMAQSRRSYESSIQRAKNYESLMTQFLVGPKRGILQKFWAGPFD